MRHIANRSLNILQRLFIGETQSDDVPLATLRHAPSDSNGAAPQNADDEEETDRHLCVVISFTSL